MKIMWNINGSKIVCWNTKENFQYDKLEDSNLKILVDTYNLI